MNYKEKEGSGKGRKNRKRECRYQYQYQLKVVLMAGYQRFSDSVETQLLLSPALPMPFIKEASFTPLCACAPFVKY